MTGYPDAARFPFPPSPIPYEPGPEIRELAGKCPVSKVELPDASTAWLATGFREVREVLIDQRYSRALLFAQDRPRHGIEVLAASGLLAKDPPEHSRHRKLVAGAFTDKRIQALRHCLGAQLARMELREAFRGLLTRLPGLRMTIPVSELEFRAGQAITSVRELPVTWDDAVAGGGP